MDITIFAWLFVIIFFCVYTTVQTRRCCKVFCKLKRAQATTDQSATTSNGDSIYTVESTRTQSGLLNTPSIRRNTNPPVYHPHLDYLLYLEKLRIDDGLPTYEQAMAYDPNNTKDVDSFKATKLLPEVHVTAGGLISSTIVVIVPETEQTIV